MVAGTAFVVAGLATLAIAGRIDADARQNAPWKGAVFSAEGSPPWPGAVPAWIRRVPINNFPFQRDVYIELKDRMPPEQFRSMGFDTTEWFLAIDLPPEAFAQLLESGRLPRKGTDEVLAGVFARADFVQVDDGAFHVVGRLKRGTGAFATAYVLPGDDVWEPLWFSTASLGWFDPNGRERIRKLDDPGAFIERHQVQSPPSPAPLSAVYAAIAGLALAAIGGGFLHQGLFRLLIPRAGLFRPAFRAFAGHPVLVFFMHFFLYGAFFLSTLPALIYPFLSVILQALVGHVFSEGSLGYVGDAYSSGNVLHAAFATWVNNFLLQTAALTILLSVIVPMLGVLKTVASFVFAGLAMTPIWSGMPGLFLFHSITMVLELEAYIYACVAVCVFWGRIAKGIRRGTAGDSFHEAAKMLASTTVLAGVLLAIAGMYEAATLILLR